MNNTNLTIATKDGVSKLVKPKFGPGMLLRAEDLDLLKDYTRDLSRLMFRSLFGCGVVCGLVVEVETDCGMVNVTVGSGLAIACSGDPIYLPKDVSFTLYDDCDDPANTEDIWIKLCSKEKCCGPRTSVCASDEDDSPTECTREKDWWQIEVVSSAPDCVCSCLPPPQDQSQDPQTNIVGAANQGQNTALATTGTTDEGDCKCATGPCYEDHYAGLCKCHCGDCSDCECKCVLLAYAQWDAGKNKWMMDHSVRRFVRPVLMRDPQPEKDNQTAATAMQPAMAIHRSATQAALNVAQQTLLKEAERAAQKRAQQSMHGVAQEIGEQAAEFVVRQVKDDVARQARREALAQQAEVEAAAETEQPTGGQPETAEEDESAQTTKQIKRTTKKSGLPRS